MTKDRDRKIREMREWLTTEHMQWTGGYPFASEIIGDELIVAEIEDDGSTRLARWPLDALVEWYHMALIEMHTDGLDWCESVRATYPERAVRL